MSDEPLDLRGMIRTDDYRTSVEAAVQHAPTRSQLQERVYAAIGREGPRWVPPGLTDEQLRELEEFRRYGDSTIRKRRTELYQKGLLVKAGVRRNAGGFKMTVWGIAPSTPVAKKRSPPPPPPVVRKRPVLPPPIARKRRG